MKTKDRSEVVVITGASAGVGRAIACAFARRGAHIGLLARGNDGLIGAQKDVEAAGGKALIISIDVADPEQMEAAAKEVEETFGPIDIWINNAMASVFSTVKEMEAVEFRRVTEVTYLGTVYGTQAALKRMLPRDKGRIIQIGSALAYRGIPLQAAYCGSKHAIKGFTESLRCELLHDKSNVKIMMVQLPAVNTPQFGWVKSRLPNKAQPVPPIFQPEVIAEGVTWLADHYRRELYIGLSTLIAIEGNKLLPGLGDWYLSKTAYKGQQTNEPSDQDKPHNLWHPLDDTGGDYGVHGTFDDKARSISRQFWVNTHYRELTVISIGIVGLIGLFLRRKSDKRI